MPEITGSLIPPRQSAAPASPVFGQMYADSDDSTLYWWDGSAWVSARGGGGAGTTITAAAFQQTTNGIAVDVAGGWKAVPIGTGVTEPSDAFTISANSVTVKDAGWYHIAASIMNGVAAQNQLYVSLGTSATPGDGNIANGIGGNAIGGYSRAGCDGSVKLTAGAKVYLNGYSPQASPVNTFCINFSIERIGGPKGDKGDTGSNATVPMDPWHSVGAAGEPAFQNGWVAGSGVPVRFRKDPLGKVFLSGNPASGGASTVAFTLPAGYRPDIGGYFDCLQGGGGATYIGISTGGAVTVMSASGCWIDSIQFDTGTVTQMPSGPKGDPGNAAVVPLVSALPGSPTDGQCVDYQTTAMAALGIRWRLVYRAASASANKWEFVGGAALTSSEEQQYGLLTNAYPTYATQGTLGLTVPLAGDYQVSWATAGAVAGQLVNDAMLTSLRVAGTNDPTNSGGSSVGTTGASAGVTDSGRTVVRALAAGAAVTLAHCSIAASGYYVRGRTLSIQPVRVS